TLALTPLLGAVVMVVVALTVPDGVSLAFAALCAMAALVMVLLPYARRQRQEVALPGALRLPLHPLFPGLAVAAAVYFSAILPPRTWLAAAPWAMAGALLWVFRARHAAASLDRRERVVADAAPAGDDGPEEGDGAKLLVCIDDAARAEGLLRLAGRLAVARELELVALHVVPQPEQVPLEELRHEATSSLERLERFLAATPFPRPPRILVRVAPTRWAGILETAREERAELVVLGWSRRSLGDGEDVVGRVFRATSRPLVVVRGEVPAEPRALSVATAGGPHAALAYQVARALHREGSSLRVCSVSTPRGPDPAQCRKAVDDLIECSDTDAAAEVVNGVDLQATLLEATDDADILVLGATSDILHGQAALHGLPAAVAEQRQKATIVVKTAESGRNLLLRRVWEAVSSFWPTLSVSEQAQVYADMRGSARAGVDFYTLISLSALIAVAGLVLDSAAVIIGAMLVAPLMSPIIALAHGIVQGNPLLMKRAASSTFKGVAVAVGISTVVGLGLRFTAPTREMLARGEPNLIDLVVALAAGAAAAYALSRRSVAAALPGVAISVALVPPLCVVGWALGAARFDLAAGALLLFLTNFAGIVLVGACVFLMLGFRPGSRRERAGLVRRGVLYSLIAILGLGVPLTYSTVRTLLEYRLEAEIERRIRATSGELAEVLDYSVEYDAGELQVFLRVVTYDSPDEQAVQARVGELRNELQAGVPVPVRVRISMSNAANFEGSVAAEGDTP
ncbi:MAG: DUF389 domain-containing protein, partial [Thermoanaerobaculia bacterium]|nr:DUF389 domain-containing protein [Thermoanaerobaculia bacterium]